MSSAPTVWRDNFHNKICNYGCNLTRNQISVNLYLNFDYESNFAPITFWDYDENLAPRASIVTRLHDLCLVKVPSLCLLLTWLVKKILWYKNSCDLDNDNTTYYQESPVTCLCFTIYVWENPYLSPSTQIFMTCSIRSLSDTSPGRKASKHWRVIIVRTPGSR